MILHTLNTSPSSPAFAQCLRLLAADDALLLMGDGVYASMAGTEAAAQLLETGAIIHALEADCRAAGLLDRLDPAVVVIDYTGFVELSERFERQQAWF